MSISNQPPSFNEDSLDSKISRLLTLQELDAEDRAEFRKEVRDRLEVLSARIHSQGERLDKTSQSTDLLTKDSEESATKLDSINKKLDYTNGAIAEAKKSIYGLEQKAKNQLAINIEIDEIIQFKYFKFKNKNACNK